MEQRGTFQDYSDYFCQQAMNGELRNEQNQFYYLRLASGTPS